jgi:hypothetical protein
MTTVGVIPSAALGSGSSVVVTGSVAGDSAVDSAAAAVASVPSRTGALRPHAAKPTARLTTRSRIKNNAEIGFNSVICLIMLTILAGPSVARVTGSETNNYSITQMRQIVNRKKGKK